MTKITKGERYTASKFLSGESERGQWEIVKIADEKGHNELTVFPSNVPTGITANGDFVVKDIVEVKYGFRRDKKTNEWKQEITVSAELEAIKSDIFVEDIDDGPLPWEEGELMEDIGLPL